MDTTTPLREAIEIEVTVSVDEPVLMAGRVVSLDDATLISRRILDDLMSLG